MKNSIRLILLLPLLSFLLDAQSRPDFSGAWVIGDTSGDSQKVGTETPFMRVEHREPRLKVTIASSSKSSDQDIWLLTTDGAENTNRTRGAEVKSHTHWQGNSLVTEWVTQANGQPMNHRQVWSLSNDGKRLTLAMRDGENETTVTAHKL
jgi:hypothetical protein